MAGIHDHGGEFRQAYYAMEKIYCAMGKKKRRERSDASDEDESKAKRQKPNESSDVDDSKNEYTTGSEAEADADAAMRESMKILVSSFSDKQFDQYEIFRRAAFPRSRIRTLMQSVCGSAVPPSAVIAMAGMAKVYVGEVVEEACAARERWRDEGPLRPKHIREAARQLRKKDAILSSKHQKVMF